MAELKPRQGSGEPGRFTPAILLLFVGSGCSALIYEIVWFHLLRLVVGASAISLGVLLGSFMGGMCLGSLLFPRLVSRRAHPLRVYALLELGIGAFGVALLFVLPVLGDLYTSRGASGLSSFLWRGAICGVALLPPTMLMGATLPAVSRWVEATPEGIAKMGAFYSANIAGAVFGTLFAGFYLLRVFDIAIATYVALALNIAVAAVALMLAARQPVKAPAQDKKAAAADAPIPVYPAVYVAIALSGFTALGAEVVWTRLLSLLMGASVYTFSLILSVFLVGLGIGSAAGAALARRSSNPKLTFAMCQLLLAGAIAYGAMTIMNVLPYLLPSQIFQPWVYEKITVTFAGEFLLVLTAFLPATILWGASFPIALGAAGSLGADPGRLVGGVYAANTVGAIAGALGISFFGFTGGGSQLVQQIMAGVAIATALMLFVSAALAQIRGAASAPARGLARLPGPIVAAMALILVCLATWMATAIPPVHPGLIAYGRYVEDWDFESEYTYIEEGVNASVAVSILPDGTRNFHVSGKIVASTEPIDMRLQRMLGHLPALIHGEPKSVLIVGCGAAVTAGAFMEYPSIERIVICEIEPKVPEGASIWFAQENRRVLEGFPDNLDERVEIVFDDARHFLATTDEKFDIITSDPIHPWVRGAAALYSAEYYELVKEHVNPGAIVTQWVPLYQTSEASVKSQVGTFMEAFPHGTVWNSDLDDIGYDIVMMGTIEPMLIDVDALEATMMQHPAVQHSMAQVDLGRPVTLLKTYVSQGRDMQPWLADAEINRDRSLRLQYLAGLALDLYEDEAIYAAMKASRRYPENLITAPDWAEQELRNALDPPR